MTTEPTPTLDPLEAVRKLVEDGEKASPGPMAYRPLESDDWGFVRDSNGGLILSTSNAWMSQEYSDTTPWPERKEGPPLVNANGRFVVESFNARPALDALVAEVERLRGIVAKLPRTADGVPVHVGSRVWCRSFWGAIEEVELTPENIYDRWRTYQKSKSGETLFRDAHTVGSSYSTKEAAEAAAKGAEE